MNAAIVYESLWGDTAEVARAIAEGFGEGARVLSTAEATPEVLAETGLVIAGAPVHMGHLPSDKTRSKAQERFEDSENWPELPEPDLTHPSMHAWLDALPKRKGSLGAAFDTRSPGKWTGNSAGRIASKLKSRGYRQLVAPTGFVVESQSGPLATGERERAVEWGREISRQADAARAG